MASHSEIKKKVEDWHNGHPDRIAEFVDDRIKQNNGQLFNELRDYVEYIEIYGLREVLPKSYLAAKYHLKEIALGSNDISKEDEEDIFYDWLKICVNPQKEINYDFFFEKNGLEKEEEVRKILFENNGKGPLRKVFKSTDWQIRLRSISDWFLKRYDIITARKIIKNVDKPVKSIFDKIKLLSPRLWGAIFIGFIPLVAGQETWDFPVKVLEVDGWIYLLCLSAFFVLMSFGYLIIECYNLTRNEIVTIKRAWFVCLKGFLISFVFSTLIVYVMGQYSVGDASVGSGWNLLGRKVFPGNIIFFASAALLIGIFIQVFWEEKTITEPL